MENNGESVAVEGMGEAELLAGVIGGVGGGRVGMASEDRRGTLERLEALSQGHEAVVAGEWKLAGRLIGCASCGGAADWERAVREYFVKLLEEDRYYEASALAWHRDVFEQRPWHVERIFRALRDYDLVILLGASKMSKCLGPEVPVMMADGTVKGAGQVRVGDQLMGDDGKPRNVLAVDGGFGPMYRIVPKRGEPWTCNDAHILSLRVNHDKRCGSGAKSRRWRKGNVVDVPIQDYLAMGRSKRGMLKQFHVGVEFEPQAVQFDGYVIGAWIGDGTWCAPHLNKPDGPMAREWCRYFASLGYTVREGGNKGGECRWWSATTAAGQPNPFRTFLKGLIDGEGNKFIPDAYMRNSRCVRLRLLAGLIDSDGHVNNDSHYIVTAKNRKLSDQICWLARSLGFSSWVRPFTGRIRSSGFEGTYHHITIAGRDLTVIPTLQKRVKGQRAGHKELTNTSFEVERIEDGAWFGFVIDGNHRFLLGDFTVTHNTFAVAAWHALDWIRDAANTSVRYGTMEEGNLRSNLWANLKALITSCPFAPRLGRISDNDMRLGVPEQRPECGLEAVLIPKSGTSSSKLKGCHPKNFREESHAVWGRSTRVRLILDEAQALLPGVGKDFGSPKTSVNARTRVMKIVLTMNPEDATHWAVKLAEPAGGFTEEAGERLYDYDSVEGWRVCRLDARVHENVVARREVYQNQVTHESCMSRLRMGTEVTSEYMTFVCGWPPSGKAGDVVVPGAWFDGAVGEPMYTGRVLRGFGADIACIADKAFLAVGRHGTASGWMDEAGVQHTFMSRSAEKTGVAEMRTVVVIDQLIELQARDPHGLAEEIEKWATRLLVPLEFVAGDATGMGYGTMSSLAKKGGVVPINFRQKPSVHKLLAEDKEGADAQTVDIVSELYWTVRQWLSPQVKGLMFSPNMSHRAVLKHQLCTRQWKYGVGNRVWVEPKEKYLRRNANSPDEADAMVQVPFIFRFRGLQLPALANEAFRAAGANVKPAPGSRWDTSWTEEKSSTSAQTADVPMSLKLTGSPDSEHSDMQMAQQRPRLGPRVLSPTPTLIRRTD